MPCSGSATSSSENCTHKMAQVIIDGVLTPGSTSTPGADSQDGCLKWRPNSLPGSTSTSSASADSQAGCLKWRPSHLQKACHGLAPDRLDLDYAEHSESSMTNADRAFAAKFLDGNNEEHRCKDTSSPVPFLGLVTRTISPSSAEFLSQKGQGGYPR